MARATFAGFFSNSNSGVCTPTITRPSSRYASNHARRYGSVRTQLTQLYVQKSTTTTRPRSAARLSGMAVPCAVCPAAAMTPSVLYQLPFVRKSGAVP